VGREQRFASDRRVLVRRVFLVDRRLYVLLLTYELHRRDAEVERRFFESFRPGTR
jgi:hypothetical protein